MARAVVEPNPVVEPIPVVDPNPCNSNCGYYLSTVIPIPIPAKNGIITALASFSCHSHMFLLLHIVPHPAKEFWCPRAQLPPVHQLPSKLQRVAWEWISSVVFSGHTRPLIACWPEKTTLEIHSQATRCNLDGSWARGHQNSLAGWGTIWRRRNIWEW